MDLVDIAQALDIEDELFLEYLEQFGMKPGGYYSTTDLYVTMMRRHRRSYQYWEKKCDFPVPNPARNVSGIKGRAYTAVEAVLILWWWWRNYALERRGRS